MRTICLYFQVHQPFRLRRYRFFNIGTHHEYFDEFANRNILRKVADKCYIPANKLMLELIQHYGKQFRISYSISGSALEQFEMYAPDVLDSFKKLAKTGCVEFMAETYSHSLAALKNKEEFLEQVVLHAKKIQELFGQKPKIFRNTELIYSDEMGAMVAEMGYEAMLTEGAKHILGWKSPNYVYTNARNPKLKVLLRNFKLTDDIAFRFSNRNWSDYPLTAEKFIGWIKNIDPKEEIINLFMDYETFGEHQWADTGIFEFLKNLPKAAIQAKMSFSTPSEIIKKHLPVAPVHVPYPISWADEERDLTAWLGNELQNDSFNKLYALYQQVKNKPEMLKEWRYLQASDHFYYMCTKWFSDGEVHKYFNPYESPYDAYINFMNVLNDFIIRIEKDEKTKLAKEENLSKTLEEKEQMIEKLQQELKKTRVVKKTTAKTTAKKAPAKSAPEPVEPSEKAATVKTKAVKKTSKTEAPVISEPASAVTKKTATKKAKAKEPVATDKKSKTLKTTKTTKIQKAEEAKAIEKEQKKPAIKKAKTADKIMVDKTSKKTVSKAKNTTAAAAAVPDEKKTAKKSTKTKPAKATAVKKEKKETLPKKNQTS